MRKLARAVLWMTGCLFVFALGSCAGLANTGKAVCTVPKATGDLVGGAIESVLSVGCAMLGGALGAPAEVGELVGLSSSGAPPEESPEPDK